MDHGLRLAVYETMGGMLSEKEKEVNDIVEAEYRALCWNFKRLTN